MTPRIFLARQVYTPPSCDVTFRIVSPPPDCVIRLFKGRLEFCFIHVTWGVGFPLNSHCSDAILVSFTTMDTGGDTIEGAEMDSPGSPLGPGGPSSPSGPGGPWSSCAPLFPLGHWGPLGPGGPYLPGGPGLPRLPLIPLGQCIVQARLLRASCTSLLMPSRSLWLTVALELYFTFLFLRFWRLWTPSTTRKEKKKNSDVYTLIIINKEDNSHFFARWLHYTLHYYDQNPFRFPFHHIWTW